MQTFAAKKIAPDVYTLNADGETFATLTCSAGRYALDTRDAELKRIFAFTEFTADCELGGVLRAVRAIMDHLAALAEHAAKLAAQGYTARDCELIGRILSRGLPLAKLETPAPVIEIKPDTSGNGPSGGATVPRRPIKPRTPSPDALAIPFAV